MYLIGTEEVLPCERVSGKRIILENLARPVPTAMPRPIVTWHSRDMGFWIGRVVSVSWSTAAVRSVENDYREVVRGSARRGGRVQWRSEMMTMQTLTNRIVVDSLDCDAASTPRYHEYVIAWPVRTGPPTKIEVDGVDVLDAFVIQGSARGVRVDGWGWDDGDYSAPFLIDGALYM